MLLGFALKKPFFSGILKPYPCENARYGVSEITLKVGARFEQYLEGLYSFSVCVYFVFVKSARSVYDLDMW